MRRYIISLSLFLGLTIMAFVVGTGDAQSVTTDLAGTETRQSVGLEPLDATDVTVISVNAAFDSCDSAVELDLPGGDITSVIDFGEDPGEDGVLSCMWGRPASDRGYRTAWYQIIPKKAGVVTLDTLNSTYDTVVAVYKGSCGALELMACNDDHQGFSSQVSINISSTLSVLAEETYYVEVADWQEYPPVSGVANLSIAALTTPASSRWKLVEAADTPALSRHATVVSGNHIYVIGGQSTLASSGASTQLHRFDTVARKWTRPTAMAGPAYFYTTAALVDGRIYVPSGDGGSATSFDGTHWAYDIAGGYWENSDNSALAAAPWPGDNPIAYSAATAADSGYYLTGGLSVIGNDLFVVHADVFFYLPGTGWSGRPPLNNARFNHMSAYVPGLGLCVAGGKDDVPDSAIVNVTECFVGGSWQDIGAAMNVGRYGAGSAVGADGNWYVFGGVGADGKALPFMEMFDPDTGVWRLLDATYELGGFDRLVVTAWPRGQFVGNTLWVVGGHTDLKQVLRQMARMDSLYIPPPDNDMLLPIVANGVGPAGVPDGTFATARALGLNQVVSQDFNISLDLYDAYYFNLTSPSGRTQVTVRLTSIPVEETYILQVYGDNKNLMATGSFDVGSNDSKSVSLSLANGRYYIMVQRLGGLARPGDYYQIKVEVSN